MPNIGRTETEAMLAGVVRNHPNDHFLQIPRVDNVARCYVCELVPGLKNAMVDFTGVRPTSTEEALTFEASDSDPGNHWKPKGCRVIVTHNTMLSTLKSRDPDVEKSQGVAMWWKIYWLPPFQRLLWTIEPPSSNLLRSVLPLFSRACCSIPWSLGAWPLVSRPSRKDYENHENQCERRELAETTLCFNSCPCGRLNSNIFRGIVPNFLKDS